MKLIKYFIITIFIIVTLFLSFLMFDLMDYDNSYINRKALIIDVKNLNSKYSHKTIFFLRNNYIKISSQISKKSKKRWEVESREEREKYPIQKIIKKKTKNFT